MIDRKSWKQTVTLEKTAAWPCPSCRKGTIHPDLKSIKYEELAASRSARQSEAWDADWIRYNFTLSCRCSNRTCGEWIGCVGKGSLTRVEGTRDDMRDEFEPRFFFPPLEMFTIPTECPETVAQPIRSSFALFFADSSAAGNHVRQAVEEMLTNKGVRRFTNGKKGRHRSVLADRIADFAVKNPSVGAPLSALKWLGNAGSHPGGLSLDDVLDAYEILDDVLDEIYVGRKRDLAKKTAKIGKRRGPVARP